MRNIITLVLLITTTICSGQNIYTALNECDYNYDYKTVFDHKTPQELLLGNIVTILKIVESNNNSCAIGDNGKAKGVLQIHEIYVKEVNNRYGTNFSHDDMFDEHKAEDVTKKYLRFFIRYYTSKYKKLPTEEHIVRCHNGGFVTGFKRITTLKYYKRYILIKNNNIKLWQQ